MKRLTQIFQKNSVFVLEIKTGRDEKERLYSLGFLPEKIVTVIKNPQNNSPLIIEIEESRFAISREIAKNIIVTPILRGRNLIFDSRHKKTQQRIFILNQLKKEKGHFTLNEFVRKIHKKNKKIGSITVYRTLKLLKERGIVEALLLPDGSTKFEIKKGHHDHIICENCGSITDFRNDQMEKLQKEIAKKHKITLDSHKVKLFAKNCLNCRNKSSG
ncbi:MAG: hypothetical protein GF335_04420 [Candidatus Moranbacteria bacterium]|nr:hypothetical protein [Candidatus Moranbacteria bacterium]